MNSDTKSINRWDRRRFLRNALMMGTGTFAAFDLKSGTLNTPIVPHPDSGLKAGISIDASRLCHAINPNIYGTFIEHIGRCIYGGVYEEGSPLADEQGFRKDVLNAVRDWGAPILRWPGGDFSSGYQWEDGVGPKETRPRKYNAAWFEEDSNHFGTDEFVDYCRKIGAEPYICVNLGTGTIQEAANWVEYCNGTGNTYYANLRRKNGHAQPHRVRYWGLGNEIYGNWQIGHKDAEDYAKIALECGKMMKWVDPAIRLVACGFTDPHWNPLVLAKLVDVADYVSLHDYEGSQDYYEELGSIQQFEAQLQLTSAAIDVTDTLRGKDPALAMSLPESRTKGHIEIACDEWNIWYRKRDIFRRDVPNPVEERYNLADALWTASVLNLFQRNGDRVTMANIAQMVNAIGTIFANEQGMFLQTIYFPMKLYRRECGSLALESKVESPVFSSRSFRDVPYLDVSSTLEESRRTLSLAVVNRHESEPILTAVRVQNARVRSTTAVYEINGASPKTENSFSEPENVKIVQKELGQSAESFNYEFPAHSVTVLKLNLAQ
ncbi:MAG TPA: alpha-L-arabinofuranosidase C-terminal domain-containing protein [Terriglobia bacterium]|nr:alpha-L-arabinofuranosidase C-terminal domain-containing protein [Terriglobia bacterium]